MYFDIFDQNKLLLLLLLIEISIGSSGVNQRLIKNKSVKENFSFKCKAGNLCREE